MIRVIFDISMSLDGLVTASNVQPEEPLDAVGAVIAARRTYDLSVPWWGSDGPAGPARVLVLVVTHAEPEEGVYTFVTDGVGVALEEAKAAAGDKDVAVMGGAEIGQQYIREGLIDEISIHLVPVLFGVAPGCSSTLAASTSSSRPPG
jgi:dihydrofolate reductase